MTPLRMNDFAREVAESVPECHKTLKRMPESQQGDKRLGRLKKFMVSQKRKSAKSRTMPKLSFEVSTSFIG